MKEKLNDEHVESVSGGIPGQLITHVVSTAVNVFLGSHVDNAGRDSNTRQEGTEADPLKAKSDGSRLIKY